MVIIILGGIGSGKTLTIIKNIIDQDTTAFCNFNIKHKKAKRLKFTDILTYDEKGKAVGVNWKFWEEVVKNNEKYSIYLDEVHNIIHSRQAMTKQNILFSKWLSQIRKILQDSPDNHLYLISQTFRKIDVDARELASVYIVCKKAIILGNVFIKNSFYNGMECYIYGQKAFSKVFLGNRYFKYYNSKEIVRFSDADAYI